jgi:hypothetical protein
MKNSLRWPVLTLALSVASPSVAENRLGLWPGMSVDEVAATLKSRCPELVVAGEDERSVTCESSRNGDATVINVTATSKGRAYFIAWHEPSSDEVMDYVKRIAAEFGLGGAGKDCQYYGYELRCWQARDGSMLYSGERDAENRHVSYIVNDRIKEEDMGPATEAPVSANPE